MPRLEEERLERDMETVFKYVIKWGEKKKKEREKKMQKIKPNPSGWPGPGAAAAAHNISEPWGATTCPLPPEQAAPSPIPINRLLMTFRSVRISLIIPGIRL